MTTALRLNDHLRNAFVRAVMDDIPKVDYEDQAEKILQAYDRARMPEKVRALWDDAALRGYLETQRVSCCGFHLHTVTGQKPGPGEPEYKQLRRMRELDEAHDKARSDMASKLRGLAHSVTTAKALADRAPEFAKYIPRFAKYIPRHQPLPKTLPAVASLVTELTAMGWPKDKEAT